MPKYYAECGDLQLVSSRETARDAALELIGSHAPEDLNAIVTISETGFGADPCVYFDSADLYEEVYHKQPEPVPTEN